MLDASYVKERGQKLGGRFAAPPNRNEDFETLRQLVVIFPQIELTYDFTDEKSFAQIQKRLKFQLAMWLGDAGKDFNKRKTIVDGLLPEIGKITNQGAWKMYQHLIQSMIAEFKLQTR